jgi:hypothetical protein
MHMKTIPTFADAHECVEWIAQNTVADADAEAKATARSRQAATNKEESFERCDTDGFLSQWAEGLASDKYRMEAEIARNGGLACFEVLVNAATGELVSTKLFRFPNRFAHWKTTSTWLVSNMPGVKWVTNFVNRNQFSKKGLELRFAPLPAFVSYSDPLNRCPEPKGLGMAHAVRPMILVDHHKLEKEGVTV